MEYRPTIGLEVHAELKTQTKMFCDCKNDPDEAHPNVNVCPVCLAHPGTLPVPNRAAVEHLFKIGIAVGGTLARGYSEFDRKSYFYPDIPKGFQISQYAYPFVSGGELAGVALTRIHLEEDTARSTHERGRSLVDFNRAGVPLMELVTEPVIRDAETAGAFARELQRLLRALSAGDANLEKGEMRIEANVSVSAKEGEFGTKVEIKNLNSFRSVERAIAYETKRQAAQLEKGEKVVQETRGWDENKQQTFSQRLKEGSADYRYFPEPDVPKFALAEEPGFAEARLAASLPELPAAHRARYEALGLKESDAAYLADTLLRSAFFDEVARELSLDPKLVGIAANYLVSDVAGWQGSVGEESFGNLTPAALAALARMIGNRKLSSRGAKDTLLVLLTKGGEPEAVAEAAGLLLVDDPEALRAQVLAVIEANPGVVAEYRAGKTASLQYLVGQVMKTSKGSADPAIIRDLLVSTLTG